MTNPNQGREDYSRHLADAVGRFMRLAGQSTMSFNAQQASLYTGLQCEELAEKLAVIAQGCVTPAQAESIKSVAGLLDALGNRFKQDAFYGDIMRSDHAQLIDADFDLAWVSLGALKSTSAMPDAATAHGIHTNLDKFRDGVVLKDPVSGKVQKPPGWQQPDFKPYVDTSVREE